MPRHRRNPDTPRRRRKRRSSMDGSHSELRHTLRIAGPVLLCAGIVFLAIGFMSLIEPMEVRGKTPPSNLWCLMIGLPLFGIGVFMTKVAYLGTVVRYVANETAPVGRDVVNFMADGTKDAVQEMAGAIGEGIAAGAARGSSHPQDPQVRCIECDEPNDSDARFCDNCGTAFPQALACEKCGTVNDSDAQFCDSCGTAIA